MLCQLYMHDSRGDGWQGAEWSGLGQDGLTLEDGFEKTFTFVVPHLPLQLTGPCSITDGGSCATSPNYPESYGNSEECIITGVPAVGLEVLAFDVEGFSESDYLTVRGKRYCGSRGPEGVVVEDGVIEWVSDSGVVKSGWKARLLSPPVCLTSLLRPPPLLLLDLLGGPAAFAAFAAFTAAFAASTASTALIAAFTALSAASTTAANTGPVEGVGVGAKRVDAIEEAAGSTTATPPWRLHSHRPLLNHRRRLVRHVAKLPGELRREREVHHHWRAAGRSGGGRI